MRGKIITSHTLPIKFLHNNGEFDCKTSSILLIRTVPPNVVLKARHPSLNGILASLASPKIDLNLKNSSIRAVLDENEGISADNYEEDDELCPVECVREFKSDEEFLSILEKSKKTNALVVVDFYRTSCGSCKYIEQGFSKLCKASGDEDVPVIFLKHNVIDEYDERSEVADRLRIKTVPLFHFYKNGTLVEAFATRDKERINEALQKHTSPAPEND